MEVRDKRQRHGDLDGGFQGSATSDVQHRPAGNICFSRVTGWSRTESMLIGRGNRNGFPLARPGPWPRPRSRFVAVLGVAAPVLATSIRLSLICLICVLSLAVSACAGATSRTARPLEISHGVHGVLACIPSDEGEAVEIDAAGVSAITVDGRTPPKPWSIVLDPDHPPPIGWRQANAWPTGTSPMATRRSLPQRNWKRTGRILSLSGLRRGASTGRAITPLIFASDDPAAAGFRLTSPKARLRSRCRFAKACWMQPVPGTFDRLRLRHSSPVVSQRCRRGRPGEAGVGGKSVQVSLRIRKALLPTY